MQLATGEYFPHLFSHFFQPRVTFSPVSGSELGLEGQRAPDLRGAVTLFGGRGCMEGDMEGVYFGVYNMGLDLKMLG